MWRGQGAIMRHRFSTCRMPEWLLVRHWIEGCSPPIFSRPSARSMLSTRSAHTQIRGLAVRVPVQHHRIANK